ncbi:hypothetical protein Tco_1413969 [Tanacetum coccineum]
MTHPSPKRNMVPKAVLMRSGIVSLTTTRPVNTARPRTTMNSARPMTNKRFHDTESVGAGGAHGRGRENADEDKANVFERGAFGIFHNWCESFKS